jgi:hypothetical protein
MSEYTKKLPAEELIAAIATDIPETTPSKILEQRDDFIRICKEWLAYNDMRAERTIE